MSRIVIVILTYRRHYSSNLAYWDTYIGTNRYYKVLKLDQWVQMWKKKNMYTSGCSYRISLQNESNQECCTPNKAFQAGMF
jgi:hypothetical protein